MKKNYLVFVFALTLGSAWELSAQLQQPGSNAYHAMALTGFNADVVANGSGETNSTTTTTIDFSNDYFSADFVPTTPYAGIVSAAAYGGGLPANGAVASSVTAGLTYQLADYGASNVLLLRPLTTSTGTLSFASPYTAASVYILWVATETQANTVGVTVNFSDGTSQSATNQIAYDWVGGSTGVALGGLSRVGNGSTQWAQLNEFSQSGACKLFEKKIDILPANQGKAITGVTFTYVGGGDYQSLAVFAINVFGEALAVAAHERTSFTVTPNPSAGELSVNSVQAVRRILIYDPLGRKIKEASGNTLSIAEFPAGVYSLAISFDDGLTKFRRIVKK